MNKLLLVILMSVVFTTLSALQIDHQLSIHNFFASKYSLNRAVHAAAQQIDLEQLSKGIYSIDQKKSYEVAMVYLQENLQLNEKLESKPGSFLLTNIQVELFQVVNQQVTFPYTFHSPEHSYQITLQRPGVIMIVNIEYPQKYRVLSPISWKMKAVAEITIV